MGMRMRLEDIIKYFRRETIMDKEQGKQIPGIYDVPESEEYKKAGIDKDFVKKVLKTYGSPTQLKVYEESTGIKLNE